VSSSQSKSASCSLQVFTSGDGSATLRIPLCSSTTINSFGFYLFWVGTPDITQWNPKIVVKAFDVNDNTLDFVTLANIDLSSSSFVLFSGSFDFAVNASYVTLAILGASGWSGSMYVDDVSFN
jgi:hypothetical protein